MLILLLFFCFIWPLVYPVPKPVFGALLTTEAPLLSPGHIFGTDIVGNDIMSRILYGGRVSFEVAAAVQIIGLAIGGLLGLVAGLLRRLAGAVLMRILDVFIAFPRSCSCSQSPTASARASCTSSLALSAFSVPAFARVSRAAGLQPA